MTIRVSQDDLDQMNALRKMQKAFPNEAEQFKARKKEWWARVRATHNIPAGAKIKLGTETGVIMDSDTGLPWTKPAEPAKPKWIKLSSAVAAELLNEAVANGDVDADSEGCAEMLDGTFTASVVSPDGTVKRDGYNNFYVKLSD